MFVVIRANLYGLLGYMPLIALAIPDFPAAIYGRIQTPEGIPATAGDMRLSFGDAQGGEVVVQASVGSFSSDVTFIARAPVESGPSGFSGRTLAAMRTYTPSVRHDGNDVESETLPASITITRALAMGGITVVVIPEDPTLSMSHDIDGDTELHGLLGSVDWPERFAQNPRRDSFKRSRTYVPF